MNYKSVIDESVIDSWSQIRYKHKKGNGLVQLILGCIIFISFLLGSFLHLKIFFYLIFFSGFILILSRFIDELTIKCPNCQKLPKYKFDGMNPINCEFCVHCLYYLEKPNLPFVKK
jgi:hypothetical protein